MKCFFLVFHAIKGYRFDLAIIFSHRREDKGPREEDGAGVRVRFVDTAVYS